MTDYYSRGLLFSPSRIESTLCFILDSWNRDWELLGIILTLFFKVSPSVLFNFRVFFKPEEESKLARIFYLHKSSITVISDSLCSSLVLGLEQSDFLCPDPRI